MMKKWIIFLGVFLFGLSFVSPISIQANSGEVDIEALVPVPPEEEVVPGGGVFIPSDLTPPIISEIEITEITRNSVRISWKTNELAVPQINYGLTLDYKKTIIGKSFLISHSVLLDGLLANTIYHFEIIAIDRGGNRISSGDRTFKTLAPPDITPPANVSNFEAISGDSQITLSWQNPPDPDFKAVKIMRSAKFYPASPEEGILIYDGKGVSFVDTSLVNGMRYYYTAFAYDKIGNYASGAIVSAIPFKIKPPPPPPPLPPPEEITTEEECMEAGYYWYDNACHLTPEEIPPPEIEKLTLKDFDFWQEGKKLPLIEEEKIKAKTEKSLTISIDYGKVPEVLKTMLVTLEKEEKLFSFLLRVNPEKTAYLATLVLPEESGIYPLTLTTLDYKNQTLKKISGELTVEKAEIIVPKVSLSCCQKIILWYEKINSALFNWFQSIWQKICFIFL